MMRRTAAITAIIAAVLLPSVSCSAHFNLAIARTFSLTDASKLPKSFDVWNKYPPCNGTMSTTAVDLFLVFSQTLRNSSAAQVAISEVKRKFVETNGWGKCISKLQSFGVEIPPDLDLYLSKEQGINPLWVNGPNRQFERTVRTLQGLNNGAYDLMYLMEMDSIPIKPYWLDTIVADIISQSDEFAVLGSKYRGDKWDPFLDQLPYSLVNHINGNAVYNLTNPLFNRIVSQLEAESTASSNCVAYDYRISQIIEEVENGNVALSQTGSESGVVLESLPDDLIAYMKNLDLDKLVRETKAIGNYASTNIVPAHLDSREAVIHGATLRESWDNRALGEVSLVVTDWKDIKSRSMLSLLDDSDHPFTRVLVMIPDETEAPELTLHSTSVEFVHRFGRYDQEDLCTAPVGTSWFMMTDSNHQPRLDIQLLVQADKGRWKPVVTSAPANDETCFSYPMCASELKLARQIMPATDAIYQPTDFVFHTKTRNEFCAFIEHSFNLTRGSPTSYFSYVQSKGKADDLYAVSDSTKYGSRHPFLPLPLTSLSSTTDGQRFLTGANNTNTTGAGCLLKRTMAACLNSAECEWRGDTHSCHMQVTKPTTIQRGHGLRANRPRWAQILIFLGLSCGGIALLTLLVIGVDRVNPSRANRGSHVSPPTPGNGEPQVEGDNRLGIDPHSDVVHDDEEDSFETVELGGLQILEDYQFASTEEGVELVSS